VESDGHGDGGAGRWGGHRGNKGGDPLWQIVEANCQGAQNAGARKLWVVVRLGREEEEKS